MAKAEGLRLARRAEPPLIPGLLAPPLGEALAFHPLHLLPDVGLRPPQPRGQPPRRQPRAVLLPVGQDQFPDRGRQRPGRVIHAGRYGLAPADESLDQGGVVAHAVSSARVTSPSSPARYSPGKTVLGSPPSGQLPVRVGVLAV